MDSEQIAQIAGVPYDYVQSVDYYDGNDGMFPAEIVITLNGEYSYTFEFDSVLMERLLNSQIFEIVPTSNGIMFSAYVGSYFNIKQDFNRISRSTEYIAGVDRIYALVRPAPLNTACTVYNYGASPKRVEYRTIDMAYRKTGINWHYLMYGTLNVLTPNGMPVYISNGWPIPSDESAPHEAIENSIRASEEYNLEVGSHEIEVYIDFRATISFDLQVVARKFNSYAVVAVRRGNHIELSEYIPHDLPVYTQVRDDGVVPPESTVLLLPSVPRDTSLIGVYSYYDESYAFMTEGELDLLQRSLKLPLDALAQHRTHHGITIVDFYDKDVIKSQFASDLMKMY